MKIEFEDFRVAHIGRFVVGDATLAEVMALFDRLGLGRLEGPAPVIVSTVEVQGSLAEKARASAGTPPPPAPEPTPAAPKKPPKEKSEPPKEPEPPKEEEPKKPEKQLSLVPDPPKEEKKDPPKEPEPPKEEPKKPKKEKEAEPAGDGAYDVKKALDCKRLRDLVEYLVRKCGIKDPEKVVQACIELRDQHGHKTLTPERTPDMEKRAKALAEAEVAAVE